MISYKVNDDGSLTPIGCAGGDACGLSGADDVTMPGAEGGFTGLAITPDGERVYIVEENTYTVWMLDRTGSGANGALSVPDSSKDPADYCVQDVAGGGGICDASARGLTNMTGSIVVSPDLHGQYVYVVSSSDGDGVISEFQANLNGGQPVGALMQLSGTSGCISESGNDGETSGESDAPQACATGYGLYAAASAAISADGQNLYVVGGYESNGQIVSLAANAETGVLSEDADSDGVEPDCYTDDDAGGFGTTSSEDADCTTFQGMVGLSYWGDGYGAIGLSPPGATTVSPTGSEVYAPTGGNGDEGVVDLSRTPPPQYTVTGQPSSPVGGTVVASSDSAGASLHRRRLHRLPQRERDAHAATQPRLPGEGVADRLPGRHRRLHDRGHPRGPDLHRRVRPAFHDQRDAERGRPQWQLGHCVRFEQQRPELLGWVVHRRRGRHGHAGGQCRFGVPPRGLVGRRLSVDRVRDCDDRPVHLHGRRRKRGGDRGLRRALHGSGAGQRQRRDRRRDRGAL